MMLDLGKILTPEEVAFVEKVYQNPGGKIDCPFHFFDDGTEFGGIHPLWTNPEKLGVIKCVGSYKWAPGDEYKPNIS